MALGGALLGGKKFLTQGNQQNHQSKDLKTRLQHLQANNTQTDQQSQANLLSMVNCQPE